MANGPIEILLARYREQKAALALLDAELAATKAQLDTALGADEFCAVDGLGEVRRVPPSQVISWNTKQLNVVIAALRVTGEDKLADQIEAARETHARVGYVRVKLACDSTS